MALRNTNILPYTNTNLLPDSKGEHGGGGAAVWRGLVCYFVISVTSGEGGGAVLSRLVCCSAVVVMCPVCMSCTFTTNCFCFSRASQF